MDVTTTNRATQDNSSKTQRSRILSLLRSRNGAWVPLPEILDLHIGQYGARILEARRAGIEIENRIERDDAGVVHSWYRLVEQPVQLELLKTA
jgi:hypothetical protein